MSDPYATCSLAVAFCEHYAEVQEIFADLRSGKYPVDLPRVATGLQYAMRNTTSGPEEDRELIASEMATPAFQHYLAAKLGMM